jgi:hypothetical protein
VPQPHEHVADVADLPVDLRVQGKCRGTFLRVPEDVALLRIAFRPEVTELVAEIIESGGAVRDRGEFLDAPIGICFSLPGDDTCAAPCFLA